MKNRENSIKSSANSDLSLTTALTVYHTIKYNFTSYLDEMRSISLPALHYTYIESYEELSFMCLRQDGSYEASTALSNICRLIQKRIEGLKISTFTS